MPVRISNQDKEEWISRFLNIYACLELNSKYTGENNCIRFEEVTTDQRRVSTVVALLKEIELINENLSPNPETIEKYIHLPLYNKKKEFEVNLYKSVRVKKAYSSGRNDKYTWKQKLIENKKEFISNGISIDSFCNFCVYIFNNQEEYYFKTSGDNLFAIPKEVYDNLNDLIVQECSEKYLRDHSEKVYSYSLGLKFKEIYMQPEEITEEHLKRDIAYYDRQIRKYKRHLKELKILQRYHKKYGVVKLQEMFHKDSSEYLCNMALLWIRDTDKLWVAKEHEISLSRKDFANIFFSGLPEE